jgi:two-component system, chemotaxis family, protein-glutamate methylesterase/glutaminase
MEENFVSNNRLIVIGGSAGSLVAVFKILADLRADFSTPVLFVVHRMHSSDSGLEELLTVKTSLTVSEVEEKDSIEPGHLYVCPPDYHVLIEADESFSLDFSEKVNFSRPSIDVVFRSAAEVFGQRLIAVLLSGANTDGAMGMLQVLEKGGITIIQEPPDAQVSYMPEQALRLLTPHYVVPADQIGQLLNQLTMGD